MSVNFKEQIKHNAFYQPVSVLAAKGILLQYTGFTSTLTDDAVKYAIERLDALEKQDAILPSEFTTIEVWAQKPLA